MNSKCLEAVALLVIVVLCGDVRLDESADKEDEKMPNHDQQSEVEDPSLFGLLKTEFLISFCNQTLNFSDKLRSFSHNNPYEPDIRTVQILIEKTDRILRQLKEARSLVRKSNPESLLEGATLFSTTELQWNELADQIESKDLTILDKGRAISVLEMARINFYLLKSEVEQLAGDEESQFFEDAEQLYKAGLFPLMEFPEETDTINELIAEGPDLKLMVNFHALFKEWNDQQSKGLDTEKYQKTMIPDFLKKNSKGLSRFVPATVLRLESMEGTFEKINIEESITIRNQEFFKMVLTLRAKVKEAKQIMDKIAGYLELLASSFKKEGGSRTEL